MSLSPGTLGHLGQDEETETETEAELCELVTAALERTGVLAGVRAQLRAALFRALDQEHLPLHHQQQQQHQHQPLRSLLETRQGELAMLLVADLLDYSRLQHTAAVYRAEVSPPIPAYPGRQALADQLAELPALADADLSPDLPLLASLLTHLSVKSSPPHLLNTTDTYDTTFTSDSSTSETNTRLPSNAADKPSQAPRSNGEYSVRDAINNNRSDSSAYRNGHSRPDDSSVSEIASQSSVRSVLEDIDYGDGTDRDARTETSPSSEIADFKSKLKASEVKLNGHDA